MSDDDDEQPPDVLTSDTDNQTIIDPRDVPESERAKYRAWRAYNTGLWNGPKRENTEQLRHQDQLHTFDAIAGQVELTSHQKERGRRFVEKLAVGDYTAPNRPMETVLFALCVALANADCTDGTRFWPHPEASSNDSAFERVAADLPCDWRDIISLVMRLENALEV